MENFLERSPPSFAELIAENEYLITQILLRLPIKSLLAFKSVSKNWLTLISTPFFSLCHTHKNPTPITSSLLMLKSQSPILLSLGFDSRVGFKIPSFDFFHTTPDVCMRVLGTCNGLVLCHFASAFGDKSCSYIICNPIIRRFITLPPPGMIMEKPILGINLAFDPSKSPYFKVICIVKSYEPSDGALEMEMFSSETGQWRKWNSPFYNPILDLIEVFDHGVYINGAIHWLCTRGDSYYFTLEEEELKILPTLPPMHGHSQQRYLGQSGGFLHLADIEPNAYFNPPVMEIHEMRKDYSGWFLKHRIDLNDIANVLPEMVEYVEICTQFLENDCSVHLCRYYVYSVLSVVRGGRESMEIVLSVPHRIIAYNPKEKSLKVLLYFADNNGILDYNWYDVHQFTETLSWV